MALRTPLVLGPDGRPQRLQAGDQVPAAASRSFGVSGAPTAGANTPAVYLDRAYTCDGVAAACDAAGPPSGGPATLTLQSSTDGATFATLAAVSIAAGARSGTAACTTVLAAGTWVRGQFTATSGVTGMVATLYLRG